MGESRRKKVSAPEISVLIPVRGDSWSMVAALTASLGDHPKVEILIGVDEDDEFWANLQSVPDNLRLIRAPRPLTLGDKLNRMAGEAKGDILWFIAQDYVMETPDWVDRFKSAVKAMPNKCGVLYPHDDLHPDHAAFPIITKDMVQICNRYFMAPYFPYWFIDTWWDEVGIMSGLKKEIDVTVKHQGVRGKSKLIKDLDYWAGIFESTRPMRLKQAIGLMHYAHGEQTPAFQAGMQDLPSRQQICAQRVSHLRHPQFIAHWEKQSEGDTPPGYETAKEIADNLVKELGTQAPRQAKVALCVPSGQHWHATMATDLNGVILRSAQAGIQVALINIQCSMISQSRNVTVENAIQAGCTHLMWIDSDMRIPPDTLIRLLRADKDIVGATYNKRVPPFESLGLFAGDPPAEGEILKGLHEALLLPGGVLLVRAEVYLKTKWPSYFETYRWPGKDGLESFKNLLKDYVKETPPDDVLDCLDDTPFADWINRNYRLEEQNTANPFLLFSEDYNFCRKARKAGYKIYCDVDLSYEVRHIGVQEVTCLPATPENIAAEKKKLPQAAE